MGGLHMAFEESGDYIAPRASQLAPIHWLINPARKVFRERFQFFFEHAGYIVGQRAQCAIALARAEEYADTEELDCVWEYEQEDPDLGDHEYWCKNARALAAYKNGHDTDNSARWHRGRNAWEYRGYRPHPCEHDVLWARLVRPCPEHGTDCCHAETLQSLGMIIDPDRDYRRVVRAELAAEVSR
jgi:hypothetical protein